MQTEERMEREEEEEEAEEEDVELHPRMWSLLCQQ